MVGGFLQQLNPQQLAAATHSAGPVLVVAGPGSGKTRVITHRVAWLLGEGVPPERIIGVTFTKRAAEEMRRRVRDLAGSAADRVWLGTFHHACARLLHESGRRFTIYDRDDQTRTVRAALQDVLGSERSRLVRPASVVGVIAACKAQGLGPDDLAAVLEQGLPEPGAGYAAARRRLREEAGFEFEAVLAPVFARYQERLGEAGAMDFDDLLLETARWLRDLPVARAYADRFLHVLVDEFQDVNAVQYDLVRLWGALTTNITAVGDPDQAIYAWRGADWRVLGRFEADFPHRRLILLEQNYRSTQSILDLADAVIRDSPGHYPRRLWTERGEGVPAPLWAVADPGAEARLVAEEAARLVGEEGFSPRDCVVLYRTNAQSRPFEAALFRHGLPYRVLRRPPFFERAEVKDVLAYLRLAANPRDEAAFLRAVAVPRRGVGARSQATFLAWARQVGASPGEAAAAGRFPPGLGGRAATWLAAFGALLRELAGPLPVAEAVRRVVEGADFPAYLAASGPAEYQSRMDNLAQLAAAAAEFDARDAQGALVAGFLEEVALLSDADVRDLGSEAVTLGTFHAAKGLEFRAVFLTGLEEGYLPHRRSLEEEEWEEADSPARGEERRLFFVGITRAKDRVYLTYCAYRGFEEREPSRYLEQIPSHLLDRCATE